MELNHGYCDELGFAGYSLKIAGQARNDEAKPCHNGDKNITITEGTNEKL